MNRFQVRAAQVPKPITWALMLSACAVGAYWWLTYAGLYRVLAELQLQHWHEYRPSYTGVVVLFACLIPAAIVIQIIGAFREKERSPEEAAAVAAAGNPVHTWLAQHRGRATALGMTLVLAGAGAYLFGIGMLAGARVAVDAGALERGEQPAGRYAELTGRLLVDDAVSVAEGGRSRDAEIYIPVVSPEWQDGQPVRAYLETRPFALPFLENSAGHYEGILSTNRLPGLVISALADRKRAAPDRYWVLQYRETPKRKMHVGLFMLGAGGICGVITAIAWAIVARRERAAGPSP